MATCKNARRDLRLAIREEKAARKAVREANARVVAAVGKLPPYWATEQQQQPAMVRGREEAQALVDTAQAASNRWFSANATLVNKRAFFESLKCAPPRKRTP